MLTVAASTGGGSAGGEDGELGVGRRGEDFVLPVADAFGSQFFLRLFGEAIDAAGDRFGDAVRIFFQTALPRASQTSLSAEALAHDVNRLAEFIGVERALAALSDLVRSAPTFDRFAEASLEEDEDESPPPPHPAAISAAAMAAVTSEDLWAITSPPISWTARAKVFYTQCQMSRNNRHEVSAASSGTSARDYEVTLKRSATTNESPSSSSESPARPGPVTVRFVLSP